MTLVAVGLSHHTSDLALRERLHFNAEAVENGLVQLRKRLEGAGVVILSTCNRVEIYVNHESRAEELFQEIRAFLCEFHGVTEGELGDSLYYHADGAVAGHLFRVASSLDSLVVGENQILGQVHDAYLAAHAEQATDKVISALFQKAFSVAKEVRRASNIGGGKVSIGSVAVDLAVTIFMELSDKTVMIVGAGEMGELALKSIMSKGIGRVLIVNRSLDKARELAQSYGGEAAPLDELAARLREADIVISSTSAPHYILEAAHFEAALAARNQAPIFVIDIAAPRDVDPAVNDLENVFLYTIDDLQQVADQNMEARRKEIEKCLVIVDRAVQQFSRWLRGLAAEPTIVSMAEELNAIRERELEKTLASLPDLSEKQREEVTYLTKRIVNTILQRPMSQLKREAAEHDPKVALSLVKRLFGLKV